MQAGERGVRPDADEARLLIVLSDLDVGGTEQQVVALAGELVKLGWDVAVYSLADGEKLRSWLVRSGARVILVPGRLGLRHPWRVMRALSVPLAAVHLFWTLLTLRPRIVHFFLPAAYLIGAPLAVLARVPVRVMSRRSLNTYQRSRFVRSFEQILHRSMQAVLGNSRRVAQQLHGEGVTSERLGLIYNGIDGSGFAASAPRAEVRSGLGLPPAAFVMCIVANLIPYKGHRDLIDALSIAAPKLPPGWQLLVVGRDDGIGDALTYQSARLGLQNHIRFLGSRDDIATILAACDAGILCSHEEGFSNAILEGMLAGLPMIVTDVGGNTEAVTDNETGLVAPARDVQRLSAALVRVASDVAARAAWGAAGRRRVIEQFGLQRSVQLHHTLYRALLAGKTVRDLPELSPSAPAKPRT
jgi:glycosyltransferase involved in cell wall biosynthesis